jgi:hypothetical protein
MWTYNELKQADAALDPAQASASAAAAALNAQTTTLTTPVASVSVGIIHGALLLAPTGDWLKIEALSQQSYSSSYPSAPTAEDAAINAAKLAIVLASSKVDSINPPHWTGFMSQLQVLVTAGAVAQDTYDQISALAPMTIPRWQPAVTAGDVQTARSQP